MKAYYSAGLKELAKASGFRGETLSKLESCSNFKRTHRFLQQAWEAIYRQMLCSFIMEQSSGESLNENICDMIGVCVQADNFPSDILSKTQTLLTRMNFEQNFHDFVQRRSEDDDTWRFWKQFVFEDCYAYMSLYLAIRTSDWHLRQSSLKLMAPLFAVFDRTTYQKLIPHHLADTISCYPDNIKKCFESGPFTVSITGRHWHSVALDECHEICINKDMKSAVVRPTKAYLKKTSLFFGYRIASHKNLLIQLFPDNERKEHCEPQSIFDTTPYGNETEQNIEAVRTIICQKDLLPSTTGSNRGLVNVFSGAIATPEQAHDLLSFRKVGLQDFENFVKHRILKQPSSAAAPVRRRRLLTMAPRKMGKKRLSQKELEHKQVTKCLRCRLAWCNETGQSYNPAQEQYSVYPRALADCNGNLHGGVKSTWTDKLRGRYKGGDTFMESLPNSWSPSVVVIDGMFLINTNPLQQTQNIASYADLLFNRFIRPHYHKGTKTVHLIFDNPGQHAFNPKQFEQRKRDDKRTHGNSKSNPHEHAQFSPSTPVKRPWREYINCRQCKRSIIIALGLAYLQRAGHNLLQGQSLVLGGCISAEMTAWVVRGGDLFPQPEPAYSSNSPEADMRLWRHALQSNALRVLIYSPDTDVYNIGLSLISTHPNTEFIVQVYIPPSILLPCNQWGLTVIFSLPQGYKGNYGS